MQRERIARRSTRVVRLVKQAVVVRNNAVQYQPLVPVLTALIGNCSVSATCRTRNKINVVAGRNQCINAKVLVGFSYLARFTENAVIRPYAARRNSGVTK